MTQAVNVYFRRLTKPIIVLCCLFVLVSCSSPEEKAQAHLERGQELMAQEEYAKAGLEFRNAVKFNEKLTQAWIGLSMIEERNQNIAGINSMLTKVLELDPKHFESLLRMGKLQLAIGDIEKALQHINKTNELKPDNTDVLAVRASILLRLNDREGARRDAERSLAKDPDNIIAHSVLAADRIVDNDMKNALLFINRGLTVNEAHLPLLLLKVRIFEQLKNEPQLEETLRKLVEFYPDNSAFRRALIVMLKRSDRREAAEQEMRALAASEPDNPVASLELVEFIASTKGTEAARKELEALIERDPAKADFKLALAEFDYGNERREDAKAILRLIIEKGSPKDDARRARLLLARFHLRGKETDKAAKLVNEVLANDEKNPDALRLRASMRLGANEIDANEVDAAIADLRAALNQTPKSVAILNLLGRALELQGAVELAEDRYSQAVALANYNPNLSLSYVSFLIRQQKVEQAEQVVVEALRRNSSNRALLNSLANMRLNRRDWAGAEEVADTLKKLGDTTGVSDQILGAVRLGQQRFDESIATFKNVYAQTQGAVRPMVALVTTYVRSGKLGEAETFLNSVLAANQNNAEAHVLLGSLKMRQKKPEEAETAYKTAIERQPNRGIGYSALARHYGTAQDIDQGLATLQLGREKVPEDYRLALQLAAVLEAKKDFEGAIKVYEDLLTQGKDAPVVFNNLVSLLSDYRSDDASFKRAHELSIRLRSTELPQFKDTLGWVEYRNGEYRAALSYLQEALEQLPNLAVLRYHLGMTYKALERPDEAKTELTKALEFSAPDDPLRARIRMALDNLG